MIDLEFDERFFQSQTMSFRIPADDPKVSDLVEDAMLLESNDRWFITKVIKLHDQNGAFHRIESECGWMRLADISRVGSFTFTGFTPADGLAAILSDTGWVVLGNTPDTGEFSMEATDASVLDLIWQWGKITGLEPTFESLSKTVDLLPQKGVTSGISFRYGRNMTSIERSSEPPLVTRIFPFGRSGIDIRNLNGGIPYLEDYSYYTGTGITLDQAKANYRKDAVWTDDTFIDENALYNAAVDRLDILSKPTVVYKASVVDLSRLMQIDEDVLKCGDTVYVYDEVLGFSLNARISRYIRYPHSPEKNKVELSFSPLLLPDNNVSSARSNTTQSWELFESRNRNTQRQVRQGSTILHRLRLQTVEGAEWLVNFKLQGVAVGNNIITVEAVDDETGIPIWNSFVQSVSDGERIDINFSYGEQAIPAGVYTLVIRSYSDSAGEGYNILGGDTAFSVLARGTTRQSVTLTNSIRYDFTGTSDTFTVPDDVSEILVEAVGSSGIGSRGGRGCKVTAKIFIVAGDEYTVEVGGRPIPPNEDDGGYPNGGAAHETGYGGSGSTHMFPIGMTRLASIIVAPGGGAMGTDPTPPTIEDRCIGGDAGFYQGLDASLGVGLTPGVGGFGASQTAGGLAGGAFAFPGTAMQGGTGQFQAVGIGSAGGGGAGGRFGGGGGEATAGGGGGSGYITENSYDLQIEDGFLEPDEDGYMIISWESPLEE